MKVIAFYLPQYHEIPENNDAWGNGFTEWVNVKKGKKYLDCQRQPRVPLGNNYYDLRDTGVLQWQAALADKYGIYGFCFYHYWFHGKMVLQTPALNLLEQSQIGMNYCFAWANESWTKTWHGAGGNREILIPQTYGGQEEWKKHYEYFRPYFKDVRYIKENGRPVLLIYRLRNIPEFNQMIKYWDDRAKKDGFKGIFLISMDVAHENVHMSCRVDGHVDFEPNRTKYEVLRHAETGHVWAAGHLQEESVWIKAYGSMQDGIIKEKGCPMVLDYGLFTEQMLAVPHRKNHYRTVFVDYDDTPRRGERGICMKNVSPEAFGRSLSKSMELSIEEGNDIVFLNAWNEWGEGNYLEPDEERKFSYLEKVKQCVENLKQQEQSRQRM